MKTLLLLFAAALPAAANPTFLQWGTAQTEKNARLAVDASGGAWLAGRIGTQIQDTNNVFLRRYNPNGTLAWSAQLGNTAQDECKGVAVDSSGNAYVCGQSLDGLGVGGLAQADRLDAFLAKFNSNGTLAWTRQLGNTGNDQTQDVAVDGSGKIYLIGTSASGLDGGSTGSFLRRYSPDGTLDWQRNFGGSGSVGLEIAVDSLGNAYIAGETTGNLDGVNAGLRDAFLLRYNADGTLAWTRQLGTSSNEFIGGVTLDGSGGVIIAGHTSGSLGLANAGFSDVFLARYNTSGQFAWVRQFGSASHETCGGIAAASDGHLYITASSDGALGGIPLGSTDGFLTQYDPNGSLLGIHRFGTSGTELPLGVAVDGLGRVRICGVTSGSLGATNAGFDDAFLAQFTIPLPPLNFQLALQISPNGSAYNFTWGSRPGKLYDLVSSTTLDTPPSTWPIWQNQQNLTASGTGTNTLLALPGSGDPKRFFAICEKDAP